MVIVSDAVVLLLNANIVRNDEGQKLSNVAMMHTHVGLARSLCPLSCARLLARTLSTENDATDI